MDDNDLFGPGQADMAFPKLLSTANTTLQALKLTKQHDTHLCPGRAVQVH